jgi:ATP-dependent DNA helicase RecG
MVTAGFRDDNPGHLQALREALVNLIIHTDYFSRANPRIRVFSNRFEFFNPGSLPKKIEYILEEDFSLPRNPIIAKIFRFVRLAESIGSGFHKMIEGWEQHYGLKPGIEGDFDYYKITFPTTHKTTHKTTQKTTQKIIALIEKSPEISRKELAEVIGLTEDGIKYHLKKMQKKGILERIGPARGGHWKIKK